jgi:DNA-binding Lrp family transcriptional regulator
MSWASSDGVPRLLTALRQRGRAPVWELGWEAGLSDAEALAAAQRLLEAGVIRRVGDDLRAPLSVWSELALVKEAGR